MPGRKNTILFDLTCSSICARNFTLTTEPVVAAKLPLPPDTISQPLVANQAPPLVEVLYHAEQLPVSGG